MCITRVNVPVKDDFKWQVAQFLLGTFNNIIVNILCAKYTCYYKLKAA